MLDLSSTLQTLIGGAAFGATVAARLTLPSGLYCISDNGDGFTWDGHDYVGLGQAFAVEAAAMTANTQTSPATMKLSATDAGVLATFMEENYRKAPCTIVVLIKDLATDAFVAEVPVFQGFLDTAQTDIAAGDPSQPDRPVIATLAVTVAPRSSKLDRRGVRTRSDADQRTHRDADDGFFKDVGQAAKTQINWGRAGPNSPVSATGGHATGAGGVGGGNTLANPQFA